MKTVVFGVVKFLRKFGTARWVAGGLLFPALLHADDLSLTNLLKEGDALSQKPETKAALQVFLKADKLFPSNAEVQIRMAEAYCDLIPIVQTKAEKKQMAEKALACGQRAAVDDPKNARAHVCIAVALAKNFPYLDNQTKVNYSAQINTEALKAIELDPKYDLSYHMLGRWNCEVANMNFFLKGLVKIVYGGLPSASNEMAIQNFKKAIELAPKRVIHHLQLAHVYEITGQKQSMTDELKACATFAPFDLDDTAAQKIAANVLATGKWPGQF